MSIDKNLLQQVKQAMHVLKSAGNPYEEYDPTPIQTFKEGPKGHSPVEAFERDFGALAKPMPAKALDATAAQAIGNPLAGMSNHISNLARFAASLGLSKKFDQGLNAIGAPERLYSKPHTGIGPMKPKGPGGVPII